MFTTRLRHPALFVLSVCLCLLAAACGSTSDLTGTSGQVAATSTTSQHPTPGHTPGVVTAGQHATLYINTGHTSGVQSVAWSPDSTRIASAGEEDMSVQVWDATTGAHALTYKGHSGAVYGVAWSPDGTRIASGSNDKTVQVWDALTGNNVVTQNDLGLVYSLAWSPDGKTIANGEALQLWNTANPKTSLVTFQSEQGNVLSVAWSPDGKNIAFGDAFGKLQVWRPGAA